MKLRIVFAVALSSLMMTMSCKKDDKEDKVENPPDNTEEVQLQPETAPSAKSEDDQLSSGVYKGTYVGSSGSFKIVLQPGEIYGIITIAGKGQQLTTTDISDADLGKSISNAVFKNENGTVELTFSVDANGSNPMVTLSIDGNTDKHAVVYKELSTAQIKVFEGFKYDNFPDDGMQCVEHINVLMGKDTNAYVVIMYSGNFIPLNNGNSGSCREETYIGEGVYKIYGDSIELYHWAFEIPGDSSSIIKDEFIFGQTTYSDQEIYAIDTWIDNGFHYADSSRLKRVL